ncbi:hypothetical protein AMTRI_Chr09g42600 [Amborella trichopoda]
MEQRNGAQVLKRGNTIMLFIFISHLGLASANQLRTYIVLVRKPEAGTLNSQERESWYGSFLPDTPATSSSSSEPRMVYAYSELIHGFAARLTSEEVESMKAKDGFLHAYPDKLLRLQTTRTPEFLGLSPNLGLWRHSGFGNGIIVGLLDTGIWPEHPSLSDSGMPLPPKKWKGKCVDAGKDFNSSLCNKKLIGAYVYNRGSKAMLMDAREEWDEIDTPRDDYGHGTHTATTAAGAFVPHADIYGFAKGTARGMAPHAHLAVYKVCVLGNCMDSDILAGLDQAVQDGVDVVSISLGGDSRPFYEDAIAIGAFSAIQKGVFVSCAAGNNGPDHYTLSSDAPWLLTVGASTLDRAIRANPKLENSETFLGESLFQPKDFKETPLPLVFPGKDGDFIKAQCEELTTKEISGKVVLCERALGSDMVMEGEVVLKMGGAAMILMNDERNAYALMASRHILPAAHVSFADGNKIKAYINSTKNPTARILFNGTVFGDTAAPVVAVFSSRGPSLQSPGILKPDIIGPGMEILAGWPLNMSLSEHDTKPTAFNMISGTSMSTPHLSGLAAMLKSSHPEWSPAAIKSAMITTAYILNTEGKPITDQTHNPADIFAVGAGHVNITQAADPGLVYDLNADDYIPYLCGLGYNETQVEAITKSKVHCSKETSITQGELNYPSFSVVFSSQGPSSFSFSRTVTNVGDANSSYEVEAVEPKGVSVKLKPNKLEFTEVNQKKSYQVVFSKEGVGSLEFSEGHIKWYSGSKYEVRSPIAVIFRR